MVPLRRPITIKALWLNRPCENKRHQKSVLSVFWVFIFLLLFSFSYSVIACTKLFGHETFNFIILFPLTFVNIRKQITLTSSSKSNIYANFKKFKKHINPWNIRRAFYTPFPHFTLLYLQNPLSLGDRAAWVECRRQNTGQPLTSCKHNRL